MREEECLEIAREIVQQLADEGWIENTEGDEGDVRCSAGDLEAIAAKVLTGWLTTDQPAREAAEVFWTGLVRREVYRLERERDEARDFARSVYRWGPRIQHAGWEEAHPWLTTHLATDQPAREAGEAGG